MKIKPYNNGESKKIAPLNERNEARMKSLSLQRLLATSAALLAAGIIAVPSLAMAAAASTSTDGSSTPTPTTSMSAATQAAHLQAIKTKGDGEINRRLTQLNKLDSLIANAAHMTASDQSYLSSEVNTEISGLTSLEASLNGATTLQAAIADSEEIFSEYRVYALVTPKIWLIKTADDQQTVQAKETTLAGKLATRLSAEQSAGKNVAVLEADLTSMSTDISNGQAISTSIEQTVLPLEPSDYNTDHSLLSSDAAKLQTAHSDDVAAASEAKTIVTGIEAL